jgi:hypothetical protein
MALTLASGISVSDRYCTVNQPPSQPSGSYYRIGDEVIQHIGFATPTPIWTPNFTQLYIARAQLGTTAASHLSAAALTYVRPEFLSAVADTDPGPFETGGAGGGGGSDVLTDPGQVWQADHAYAEGDRIAEMLQGELRVFEATNAGTTEAEATAFTDYTISLAPLGLTLGNVTWQYLGIVGELPWDIVPLPGIGLNDQGFHVDAFSTVGDAETMLQLLPALGDPGNAWESATLINTPNYRIASLISGSLRVFEAVTLGTTGGSEPTWQIALIGQTTTDGTASWSYRGIVGQPDTDRPVFVVNSAGDADWYFDQSNSSGFRFNQSVDGVPVSGAGRTEMTTDHFKAAIPGGGELTVQYDPFAIIVLGLPTADPVISGHLWNSAGTLKVSAG